MSRYIWIIFTITIMLLSSCNKQNIPQQPVQEWGNITVPFKISQHEGISASGKAYMVRNEYIYASIRMLGIEFISFYANNDSVFFYDKTHKTLVSGSLGKNPLTNKRLDINQLQDLLLGINESQSNMVFNPGNFIITIRPLNLENHHRFVSGWKATVVDNYIKSGTEIILRWNLDDIIYDKDALPRWKKPAVKETISIEELPTILSEQL